MSKNLVKLAKLAKLANRFSIVLKTTFSVETFVKKMLQE